MAAKRFNLKVAHYTREGKLMCTPVLEPRRFAS